MQKDSSKLTCPKCPTDEDYTVRERHASKTMAGDVPGEYDEDGNYHPPIDRNKIKQHYRCSNGHTWVEERRADRRYKEKVEDRVEAGLMSEEWLPDE